MEIRYSLFAGLIFAAFFAVGSAFGAPYGHGHGPSPRPPSTSPKPPTGIQQQIQQQQILKSASPLSSASRMPPVAASLAEEVDTWSDFGSLSDEELAALFKEMGLDVALGTGFSGDQLVDMLIKQARAEGLPSDQIAQLEAMLRSNSGPLASTLDSLQSSGATDLARAFKQEYARTCMCDDAAFATALSRAETRVIADGEARILSSLGVPPATAREMAGTVTVVYDRTDDEIKLAGNIVSSGGGGNTAVAAKPPAGSSSGSNSGSGQSSNPAPGAGGGSSGGSDSSGGGGGSAVLPPSAGPVGGGGNDGKASDSGGGKPASPPIPGGGGEDSAGSPPPGGPGASSGSGGNGGAAGGAAVVPGPAGSDVSPGGKGVPPLPGSDNPPAKLSPGDGTSTGSGPNEPSGTQLTVRDDRIVVDEKGNVIGKIVPPNLVGGKDKGRWEIIDPDTALPVREIGNIADEFTPEQVSKLNELKVKDRKDQLTQLADVRQAFIDDETARANDIENIEAGLEAVKWVGSQTADYLAEYGKGPVKTWGEGLQKAYELADSYGENLGSTGNQKDALIGMLIDTGTDKIGGFIGDKVTDKVGGSLGSLTQNSGGKSNRDTLEKQVVGFLTDGAGKVGEAVGDKKGRVIGKKVGREIGKSTAEGVKEGAKDAIGDPIKNFLGDSAKAATGADGSGEAKGVVGGVSEAASKRLDEATKSFEKIAADPGAAGSEMMSSAAEKVYEAGKEKVSDYVGKLLKGKVSQKISGGEKVPNAASPVPSQKIPAV